MKTLIKYKGFYTDSLGKREIEIGNDFNTLTMEVNGVLFYGSGFDDMSVDDRSKYTAAQLAGFTFLRTPVYQKEGYVESLCNCAIEIVVPQVIIDKLNNAQFSLDLTIQCVLGKPRPRPGFGIEFEKVTLTLIIAGNTCTGIGADMESAFDGIRKQIDHQYMFKNCYGCQYGDYSVYGQGCFGTMLCYRNKKEQYNQVTNKEEYIDLDAPDSHVQETYCCDQYETRKYGAGYRG